MEGQSKLWLHGIVATADLGYGNLRLFRRYLKRGMAGVIVVPDHVLPCHPFVARSCFRLKQHEEETERF